MSETCHPGIAYILQLYTEEQSRVDTALTHSVCHMSKEDGMRGMELPYQLRSDWMVTCVLFLCFILVSYVLAHGKKHLEQQFKNFALSKERASLFDDTNVQSAAETHLAHYEDFIRSMKPRFVKRGARPLLLTTLIDPRHMLVFGPNSLFQEILDEYGIPNAWQGETNFWGSTAVSIDRLAAYKDVDVLCFDHDNSKDMDALMATPLWQAMPFVRTGRFQRVPAVWFYGATLSAMHFVRVLDNAIGGKA